MSQLILGLPSSISLFFHRDIIQALALRRAQQQGIELPWYNHQTTGDNQGDLPWLDPFSAQPRMVQSVSSSQSAQGQPEISSTAAQPSDPGSLVASNDAVLTEAMPVFSETNLTRQDISSTAAQQSDPSSLVVPNDAVLTEAMSVVLSLIAPDLGSSSIAVQPSDCDSLTMPSDAGAIAMVPTLSTTEVTGRDISSTSAQLCDHGESLAMSNDAELTEKVPELSLSAGDLVNAQAQQETSVDSDAQCSASKIHQHNDQSDYEILTPHQFAEEATEMMDKRDDDDLAMHAVLSADASRNSFCISTSSSSDNHHSSRSHDSIQSIDCEHLTLHQKGSTEQCTHSSSKCDDHDLSEDKPTLPGETSLEVEGSFYSSKTSNSEEESSSDFYDNSTLQSANQCTKSNDCGGHSTDDSGAEKQLPGDASQELDNSASINSGDQTHVPPPGTSLEEVNSYRASKIIIDDQSSSDFCQNSTQSIDCEHLSLHQVASTAQCVHTASRLSNCDQYDLGENEHALAEEASLEVKESFYSSKTSNSEEESSSDSCQDITQSTSCEHPSLHHVHEAPTAKLTSDESCNFDERNTCNADEIITASLEFKQMVYKSRSSTCRIGHIYSEYNNKPLLEDSSLEVNASSHSFKMSTSNSCSLSCFHQNNFHPTDCKHLSPHEPELADQCTHGSSKSCKDDNHSTPDLDAEELQSGDAYLEVNYSWLNNGNGRSNSALEIHSSLCRDAPLEPRDVPLDTNSSFQSSNTSSSDNAISCQTSAPCIGSDHLSLHQAASGAQFSSKSINDNEHIICDMGEKNPQPEEDSLEVDYSFHISRTSDSDGCHSSDFQQDKSDNECLSPQDTKVSERLYPQVVASADPEVMHSSSNVDHHSTCDLSADKPLLRDASQEVNNSNNNDDCSSSLFCQEGTQSTDCEHLSLHQVASTTPCVHSSSTSSSSDDQGTCNNTEEEIQPSSAALELTMNPSGCSFINHASQSNYNQDVDKPLPGDSSLEANVSKMSNGDDYISPDFLQDSVQTADDKQQSPHSVEVADQCVQSSPKTSNGDDCSHHDSGVEKPLPGDALISSKSNNSDDCNLVVHKSLPGDASLETNGSFRASNGDNHSSSTVEDNAQSLSLFAEYQHQHPYYMIPTDQCMHSSSDDDSFYLSDKKSLPGELSSSSDNDSFHRVSTVGSEHRGLCQVEATVQRLPRFSDHQLSPVGSVVSSEDEICIIMELDEGELPHCYDKELSDTTTAIATENSHHTVGSLVDASTDYSTALSECSSGGFREMGSESSHSAASSGVEYRDCAQDCVQVDKEEMDDTTASSSASMSKRLLDGSRDSNYSLRRHSTLTPCNILGELSESNMNEGEQRTQESTQSSDCEGMNPHHEASAAQRVRSGHQLSPVGSVVSTDHNVCIVMELDEGELPQCYDKELSNTITAITTEASHHSAGSLVNASIDYSTALSECSSGGLREVGSESSHSVASSGLEYYRDCAQDCVQVDKEEMDDTKASNCASVSKRSLDESCDSNNSLNAPLRRHSTITPCTIMGRFCVSNVSEWELHKDFTQSTVCEGMSVASADQGVYSATGHQLSPVGSLVDTDDEIHIIMELNEEESPNIIGEISDTSTEYYTALSQFSSGQLSSDTNHSAGARHSEPVMISSGSESIEVNMEPLGSRANLLKMSSSASLFIPRGFSNGPLPDNDSSSLSSFQRNDSTTTFHSILGQLSGSSASEGDQEQRQDDPLPNQTPPIYEPY